MAITKEAYDELVSRFRERPGDIPYVMKATGRNRNFVKQGWLVGWERHAWAKPIKAVIATDKKDAVVELVSKMGLKDVTDDERDMLLRRYAVLVRKAEAEAIYQGTESFKNLLTGFSALAKKGQELLIKAADSLELEDMDPVVAISIAKEIAITGEKLIKATSEAVKAQRLSMGEASNITEHRVSLSDEEAMHRLKMGSKILERRAKVIDVEVVEPKKEDEHGAGEKDG